jgi:hypothetical protein
MDQNLTSRLQNLEKFPKFVEFGKITKNAVKYLKKFVHFSDIAKFWVRVYNGFRKGRYVYFSISVRRAFHKCKMLVN